MQSACHSRYANTDRSSSRSPIIDVRHLTPPFAMLLLAHFAPHIAYWACTSAGGAAMRGCDAPAKNLRQSAEHARRSGQLSVLFACGIPQSGTGYYFILKIGSSHQTNEVCEICEIRCHIRPIYLDGKAFACTKPVLFRLKEINH
ncbi:hypothetical protein M5D96_002338 [Drosophila gunungcola]|uniref:Uncharacterized protein n=1 Tax=Drosophila gunungcola TaxID=103775 RepID=A0A9P9Z0A5_9MUSC|nr:hypothetical protein M5D96_002338 [Drosophila gunungcola]